MSTYRAQIGKAATKICLDSNSHENSPNPPPPCSIFRSKMSRESRFIFCALLTNCFCANFVTSPAQTPIQTHSTHGSKDMEIQPDGAYHHPTSCSASLVHSWMVFSIFASSLKLQQICKADTYIYIYNYMAYTMNT